MPRTRTTSGKMAAEVMTNTMLTRATSNSIVASARNLTVNPERTSKRKIKTPEWQRQAWYFYDVVEVYHYGVQWVGNTLSRAKLLVTRNGKPATEQAALDLLASFFGGVEQHGEFLRQAAVHMTVAGEGYILAQEIDGEDEWMVAAASEIRTNANGEYKFDGETLAPSALLIRLWRPHPRKPSTSDCPTRPLLPILSQIEELTKYVSAQIDSRLSGAGLLLVPSEATLPTPVASADGKQQQTAADAFIQEIAETMAAAKLDREDASARVPTMLQAPGETLKDIKHLTFWTELDATAEQLRNEAIRRLALGMDMPPEALLGTADMNHWGSWQMEESLIKAHSEPLLALITQAITTHYLRVMLMAEGMSEEEAAEYEVTADTTEMRLRPNRSKEALELYDRGEVSGLTVRRENGFDEDDAMKDDERKTWLLKKLAQGSPSPELVAMAAKSLGVDIEPSMLEGDDARGERPLTRSLEEHPTREIPNQEADAAALLATGEAAVLRALERYGNRLKSTSAKLSGIPANIPAYDRYQYVSVSKDHLDFGLQDAWSFLERVELPAWVKREEFEAHLDNYVRMLITSQQPYDRALLGRYLNLVKRAA